MFSLKGKVAVVTGSGRGIGAAAAGALAAAGAKVVLSSRHGGECAEVASGIKKSGGEASFIGCDVSDEGAVRKLMEGAAKRYGNVDILVNNAGVYEEAPIESMDSAFWRKMLSIDLDGVFYCTKHAIPLMKKGKWGRIINISSVAGIRGSDSSAAYCAAKFGMIGFTKSAAAELAGSGITVNAVCPGIIETRMTEGFLGDEKAREAMLRPVLVKRVGRPADIAAAVLYLASEEASYVTGTELVVDGGWTSHL